MDKKIILECEELMLKYGHLPFNEGQPLMKEGWLLIGNKYGMTGAEVLDKYLTWKGID